MPKTNPQSRYDDHYRLRPQYRTDYVTGYCEKARLAGVPAEAIDYDDESGNAWYYELMMRISQLAHDPAAPGGQAQVEAIREAEDTIRLGLSEYCGIDDEGLVPRMSRLSDLRQRQQENAR